MKFHTTNLKILLATLACTTALSGISVAMEQDPAAIDEGNGNAQRWMPTTLTQAQTELQRVQPLYDNQDWNGVLGVNPTDSWHMKRSAWRRLMLRYHPDKCANDAKATCRTIAVRLNNAKDNLDPNYQIPVAPQWNPPGTVHQTDDA